MMINLTLILCTRNDDDDRLVITLESVVNLKYKNYHLIIVNDSHKPIDNAIIIMLKKNMISHKIINNYDQIGLTKSLNKGIELVNTEYIGRLDAGDRCFPDRFLRELECLDANPEIGLCACQANIIVKKGETIKIVKSKFPTHFYPANLYFRNTLVHGAIVLRTNALKLCGNYNINFDLGQDYEMYLRLVKKHKIILLPYLGYEKCFYENSSTMNKSLRSSVNALRAKFKHFPKDNLFLVPLAVCGLFFSSLQIIRGLIRR